MSNLEPGTREDWLRKLLGILAESGNFCDVLRVFLKNKKTRRVFFFPKASPMLGFSFSLLEGGVERDRTGPRCGWDV